MRDEADSFPPLSEQATHPEDAGTGDKEIDDCESGWETVSDEDEATLDAASMDVNTPHEARSSAAASNSPTGSLEVGLLVRASCLFSRPYMVML